MLVSRANLVDGQMCVKGMKQEAIAGALGRTSTDRIGAALRELVDAGLVEVNLPGARRRAEYTILVHAKQRVAGGYDVVPYPLMTALGGGAVTPTMLVTWLHVDQALGDLGWTMDTPAEIGDRRGLKEGATGDHLRVLAQVGLLSRTMLTDGYRLEVGPATGRTATGIRQTTAETANVGVDEVGSRRPSDRSIVERSGSENAGSFRQKMRGPYKRLTPEALTPVEDLSSFAKRSHLGERMRDGRERPKEGITSAPSVDEQQIAQQTVRRRKPATGGALGRKDVREVLAGIDSQWSTGQNARWRPGLASQIATALDGGDGHGALPRAVVMVALTRWATPDDCGGKVVAAARRALRNMRREIAVGLRCLTCGCELTGSHAIPVEGGRTCVECYAAHLPEQDGGVDAETRALLALPLTERVTMARASVRALGLDAVLATLEGYDPEVATALRLEAEQAARHAARAQECREIARSKRLARAGLGGESASVVDETAVLDAVEVIPAAGDFMAADALEDYSRNTLLNNVFRRPDTAGSSLSTGTPDRVSGFGTGPVGGWHHACMEIRSRAAEGPDGDTGWRCHGPGRCRRQQLAAAGRAGRGTACEGHRREDRRRHDRQSRLIHPHRGMPRPVDRASHASAFIARPGERVASSRT